MKKYITTEKHPFGKGHLIVEKKNEDFPVFEYKTHEDSDTIFFLEIKHFDTYKRYEWVKKIQEPKWTDDQMIEFYYFVMASSGKSSLYDILESFEKKKKS